MTVVVYTIGHSTRSFEELLALLNREGVRALVDVRAFPTSRRYPHFDRERLAASLEMNDIAYTHAPALGGRRSPRPDSPHGGWRNPSFRAYADHMSTPTFREAIDRLVADAAAVPTSVMCAEAVPWRCHRSLIADALMARGCEVRHVLDAATNPHALTAFARVVDGEVAYPPPGLSLTPQTDLFDSG